MTWLLATMVVLSLGVVAVLASGRFGGALPPAYDDRPDTRLPEAALPDGPLSPEDLRRVRFPLAVRGYRMEEVDALLARLADEVERRSEGQGEDRFRGGEPTD
jgi:DivIVA domain-containing protein